MRRAATECGRAGRRVASRVCMLGLFCAGGMPGRGAAGQETNRQGVPAQAAATQGGSYRIAGRIVSGVDGHALERAQVRILEMQTNQPVETVVADGDGRFVFAAVKAGKVRLQGEAPGYLMAGYQQHQGLSTAIVTGAGLDTESLVLQLMPQGVIAGRVLDEVGEPVRAQVQLYLEDHTAGEKRIQRTRGASTNDLGEYAFDRLAPGRYFLSVQGTPWYAVHPQPPLQALRPRGDLGLTAAQTQAIQRAQTMREDGPVEGIDRALDVAYPLTFYPGATEESGAGAIEVKAGEEAEADVQLTPVAAVTIDLTIDLTRPAEEAESRRSVPQVQRRVFGGLEMVPAETRQSPMGNLLVGLPPGEYTLRMQPLVQMPPRGIAGSASTGSRTVPSSGDPASAVVVKTVRVDASGAVEENTHSAAALGRVRVQAVQVEDGKPGARRYVGLIRVDGPGGASGSTARTLAASPGNATGGGLGIDGQTTDAKGAAEFAGVTPGVYAVRSQEGEYVAEVRVEGTDGAVESLPVGAGATVRVTVTLGRAKGRVEGFVKDGKTPVAGAMVLLVPVDAAVRGRSIWREQSNLDGSFAANRVPAGRYIAVAIEDGWTLDWRQEEVLARYLPQGAPLVMGEGGVVRMTEAVVAQAP